MIESDEEIDNMKRMRKAYKSIHKPIIKPKNDYILHFAPENYLHQAENRIDPYQPQEEDSLLSEDPPSYDDLQKPKEEFIDQTYCQTHIIQIADFDFSTQTIIALVGDTLFFELSDRVPLYAEHIIVGRSDIPKLCFESGLLHVEEQRSYSVKLEEAGEIYITCKIYNDMNCHVTVISQSESLGFHYTLDEDESQHHNDDDLSENINIDYQELVHQIDERINSVSSNESTSLNPLVSNSIVYPIKIADRDDDQTDSFASEEDILEQLMLPTLATNLSYNTASSPSSSMFISPSNLTYDYCVDINEFSFQPNNLTIKLNSIVQFKLISSAKSLLTPSSTSVSSSSAAAKVTQHCQLFCETLFEDIYLTPNTTKFTYQFTQLGNFVVKNEIYSFAACHIQVIPENNHSNDSEEKVQTPPKLFGSFAMPPKPIFHCSAQEIQPTISSILPDLSRFLSDSDPENESYDYSSLPELVFGHFSDPIYQTKQIDTKNHLIENSFDEDFHDSTSFSLETKLSKSAKKRLKRKLAKAKKYQNQQDTQSLDEVQHQITKIIQDIQEEEKDTEGLSSIPYEDILKTQDTILSNFPMEEFDYQYKILLANQMNTAQQVITEVDTEANVTIVQDREDFQKSRVDETPLSLIDTPPKYFLAVADWSEALSEDDENFEKICNDEEENLEDELQEIRLVSKMIIPQDDDEDDDDENDDDENELQEVRLVSKMIIPQDDDDEGDDDDDDDNESDNYSVKEVNDMNLPPPPPLLAIIHSENITQMNSNPSAYLPPLLPQTPSTPSTHNQINNQNLSSTQKREVLLSFIGLTPRKSKVDDQEDEKEIFEEENMSSYESEEPLEYEEIIFDNEDEVIETEELIAEIESELIELGEIFEDQISTIAESEFTSWALDKLIFLMEKYEHGEEDVLPLGRKVPIYRWGEDMYVESFHIPDISLEEESNSNLPQDELVLSGSFRTKELSDINSLSDEDTEENDELDRLVSLPPPPPLIPLARLTPTLSLSSSPHTIISITNLQSISSTTSSPTHSQSPPVKIDVLPPMNEIVRQTPPIKEGKHSRTPKSNKSYKKSARKDSQEKERKDLSKEFSKESKTPKEVKVVKEVKETTKDINNSKPPIETPKKTPQSKRKIPLQSPEPPLPNKSTPSTPIQSNPSTSTPRSNYKKHVRKSSFTTLSTEKSSDSKQTTSLSSVQTPEPIISKPPINTPKSASSTFKKTVKSKSKPTTP